MIWSRKFSYWFLAGMLFVILSLFFVYTKGSGVGGFLGNYGRILWTALIFLFLLLGIITISLVLNRFRKKEGFGVYKQKGL